MGNFKSFDAAATQAATPTPAGPKEATPEKEAVPAEKPAKPE